eukprot:scaffold6092_cov359-Prasinococcus_capsulatus_cf.AAC.2
MTEDFGGNRVRESAVHVGVLGAGSEFFLYTLFQLRCIDSSLRLLDVTALKECIRYETSTKGLEAGEGHWQEHSCNVNAVPWAYSARLLPCTHRPDLSWQQQRDAGGRFPSWHTSQVHSHCPGYMADGHLVGHFLDLYLLELDKLGPTPLRGQLGFPLALLVTIVQLRIMTMRILQERHVLKSSHFLIDLHATLFVRVRRHRHERLHVADTGHYALHGHQLPNMRGPNLSDSHWLGLRAGSKAYLIPPAQLGREAASAL